MKFYWKTNDIIIDLSHIKEVDWVDERPPGGDVDTDNLAVHVDGSPDSLWVCGFVVENDRTCHSSNTKVDMIQITDGLDSRGGLNSKNPLTAQAYIAVRQYFVDRDAEVVDSMDPYF